MDAAVPLSELIVQLIAAIGVGPFILVVFVLLIVGIAPGIINRIFDLTQKKRDGKELHDAIVGIQTQIEQIFNIEKLSNERISKLTEHVNSIQSKMRNVMSEDDVIRYSSVKLGVEEDFKTKLLHSIVRVLIKTNGHLRNDLKFMLNNHWQNLKNDLYSLNAPIDLRGFMMLYDEKFSETGELFIKIIEVVEGENTGIERKKERISILLDSVLMEIRNDLSSRLKGN